MEKRNVLFSIFIFILLCSLIVPIVLAWDSDPVPKNKTVGKDVDSVEVDAQMSAAERRALERELNKNPDIFELDQDNTTYDFAKNRKYEVTRKGGKTVITVVQEEREFEDEDFDSPSPSPSPVQWRCYTNDGENMDRRQWQGGWIGSAVDCGTSSGWSGWSCKNANTKKQTRTIKGCSGGSCYANTAENPINCQYGCSGGQCQPHADFDGTVLNEDAATSELEFDAGLSRDPYSGTKLTYSWSYSTGGTDTGKIVTRTFPKIGNLQITLTVTTTGLTSATEAPDNGTTAIAAAGGPTIIINAEPTPLPGVPAILNATGTTDDKDTPEQLEYKWDYDSDGVIDNTFDSTTSATPQNEPGTHNYLTTGPRWVKLTATDTDGLFSTESVLVDVQNQNPVVVFKCAPGNGLVPLTINCTNNSYDPDGHTIEYNWTFEAGVPPETTQNASYVYNTEGAKTVTLTVTDQYGGQSSLSQTISITQPLSITILNTNHPATKTDPAFIVFACNKSTNIKLSYTDNTNNTVLPDGLFACTKTPSTTQAIFPESAVYKIVARITDAGGTPDLTCGNCPKTVYSVVGMEVKDLETPETTPLLVVTIGFIVAIALQQKKRKR